MAKVIGISGKRGTGKSLLSNPYLLRRGFKIFNFADLLKSMCQRDYGVGPEHTNGNLKEVPSPKLNGNTPRDLMIAEGQLKRKFSMNGMYWVDHLFKEKINLLAPDTLCAIADVRFKNEADYIRAHGGFIVRLNRKIELNIYKGEIDDSSETDLDNYSFDLTLTKEKNRTPQDLERFADEIVAFLMAHNAKR